MTFNSVDYSCVSNQLIACIQLSFLSLNIPGSADIVSLYLPVLVLPCSGFG